MVATASGKCARSPSRHDEGVNEEPINKLEKSQLRLNARRVPADENQQPHPVKEPNL